jgi:hypothetical protein
MKTVTLSGHVEGTSIKLDEPFDFPSGSKLLITLLPTELSDAERSNWMEASKSALARAYSDHEPEYSTDLIQKNGAR